MEKTNIRYVTPEDIEEPVEFASIDVSFISLTKVLGPVKELLTENGQIVCLIKPQFEAGREKVGKKGVVREKSTHLEVIEMVISFAVSIGFEVMIFNTRPSRGLRAISSIFSTFRITGPESILKNVPVNPSAVVEAAHGELDK